MYVVDCENSAIPFLKNCGKYGVLADPTLSEVPDEYVSSIVKSYLNHLFVHNLHKIVKVVHQPAQLALESNYKRQIMKELDGEFYSFI